MDYGENYIRSLARVSIDFSERNLLVFEGDNSFKRSGKGEKKKELGGRWRDRPYAVEGGG